MSPPQILDELIETLRTHVREEVRKLPPRGDLLPQAVLVKADGGLVHIAIGGSFLEDSRTKDLMTAFIAQKATEHRAIAAAFVFAGWVRHSHKDAPMNARGGIEGTPGTREIVMVNVMLPDSIQCHHARVWRHLAAPPRLGPWETDASDDPKRDLASGRFYEDIMPVLARNRSQMAN